ncbi:UPF0489 protein C5orf22 homolog [Scaptodrosophila lebanonensis]|uniref:UPF0489 protein C5orf22 homolog n=1 Tax=Drosophila lebanonensis TaxID=7225 RepID=A0A6J2UFD3_DROLE|nr:UPF0489 protein C5orf22 homolog [Scaptodrosophila lebanonensis]
MESDTVEQNSTQKESPAKSQTFSEPIKAAQSESLEGDETGGSVQVEADVEAQPPSKRSKVEDQPVEKEKEVEDDEDEAPELVSAEDDSLSEESLERVQSTQSSLRRFKQIPVFIVDYHNDVLEFIYRCLASRHLPLENNILVHFDSHPDLVIANDIPASASYDKDTMLTELSIENWIMPTLYAGHFNRMVWLKNSWCQQIPTGKHEFKIGHKNDRIGIDCPLDYFIADGNYCPADELEDARTVKLQVYDADSESLDPREFITEKDAQGFILDIDLDFFSTSNPFLEIYKDVDCYSQLKEIFHFESVESVKQAGTATIADYRATAAARKKQLDALKRIFWQLDEHHTLDGMDRPDESVITPEVYAKIIHLAESLKTKYVDDEIDWLLIFDSGSTTDNNGLPHHISTSEELDQYFAHFKRFLQRLPVPPVAITMSCSVQDDYCPQNQVAFIEEQVLRLLREVFGERVHDKPILHYMDDEWNVMKL